MTITRMNTAITVITVITTLCILGCCLGCAAPEPVAPTDKLARENAYYYQKAETYFSRGCYPRAMAYFEDAHERYTAADDGVGIAHSLNGIANVYLRIGDQESALLLYDETIAAYDRIGSTQGQIRALCNKAAVLIAAQRLTEAAAVLDQADARSADSGELIALRTKTRALLSIQLGDTDNARLMLRNALVLTASADTDPGTRADILFTLGRLVMPDQPAQACDQFNQALAIDQASQNYAQVAKDLKALGLCSSAQGLHGQALEYFKRSAKIFALNGNSDQIAQIMPLMEQSVQKTGTDIQAVSHYIRRWLAGDTEADLCD